MYIDKAKLLVNTIGGVDGQCFDDGLLFEAIQTIADEAIERHREQEHLPDGGKRRNAAPVEETHHEPEWKWKEDDLAWLIPENRLVKIAVIRNDTMSFKKTSNTFWLSKDHFSVPTPEQLLVDLNGVKVCAWECHYGIVEASSFTADNVVMFIKSTQAYTREKAKQDALGINRVTEQQRDRLMEYWKQRGLL